MSNTVNKETIHAALLVIHHTIGKGNFRMRDIVNTFKFPGMFTTSIRELGIVTRHGTRRTPVWHWTGPEPSMALAEELYNEYKRLQTELKQKQREKLKARAAEAKAETPTAETNDAAKEFMQLQIKMLKEAYQALYGEEAA